MQVSLPFLDEKESKIVNIMKDAEGDMFRIDLRKKVGGSNTTFIKKIASLKKKGIIEEYKRSNGRLRTAYKFTDHARRLFDLDKILSMEKWFSAHQKIELFPELESVAQMMVKDDLSIYKMLGIEPLHISLETSLATDMHPTMKEEDVRETLSMISAFLQNIVTGRLNPRLDRKVEGYIIFHYQLEKPKEEIQQLLPQCLMDYVKAKDALEQHNAVSRLVELAIHHPDLLPMLTMAASTIARSLRLENELQILLENYKSYKEGEKPMHWTCIRLAISALEIFKKLYDSYKERSSM
ncbi:MAG: hypothetical protein H3Z54_12220 [archaeon]|nr:hypothetical protein [archaeon]